MAIYIGVILLIILIYCCIKLLRLNADDKNKLFLFCAFVLLIFIGGFRSENVGGDLVNYIQWYKDASSISLSDYMLKMERVGGKGYFIFTYFLNKINSSSTFYLFSCSLVTLSSVAIFIKRYSNNYLLSILLFICMGYYINTFNNVRSSISYSILLFSFPYIINKKFIKFLIIYLIALSFHTSIFPFIIAYFVDKKKFNIYVIISLGLIAYFICAILEPYIMLIMTLYSSRYLYAQELFSNTKGTSLFLLLCSFLIFANIYIKHDRKSTLFYNIFSIAILLQPLASIAGNLNRLTQIFAWSIIILIPNAISCLKKNRLNLLCKIIILCLLVTYFTLFICKINPSTGTNSSATLPYHFIWE